MIEIEPAIIFPETSLKTAMEAIDEARSKVAVVIDEDQRLIAFLTDGDIRRGLLRGKSITDPVRAVANYDFATVLENKSHAFAKSIMLAKGIQHLPVVDDNGRFIKLLCFLGSTPAKRIKNRAILMAGGKGTRLLPLTKNIPKPMLEVQGKPLLHTIVDNLLQYGVFDISISINYLGNVIKDYFGDGSELGAKINYIQEKNSLGTAGALSLLKPKPTENFIVMNADLVSSADYLKLLKKHSTKNAAITICTSEYKTKIPYGVLESRNGSLIAIREKPEFVYEINSGIYILSPNVLKAIKPNSYLDMPTLINILLEKNEKIITCPLEGDWLDIGEKSDLDRARLKSVDGQHNEQA